MSVNRINVTGNAGAGKSTLARRLGERLQLPVVHLDQVVWQPGWRKTPADERAVREAELIAEEHWVIDGVSGPVREAADLVIYLDRSRLRCYYQAFKRNLPYLFRSRPELPEGCPELLIMPHLVRMIWRFPRLIGRGIEQEAQGSRRFRRVRSPREIERLVAELTVTAS